MGAVILPVYMTDIRSFSAYEKEAMRILPEDRRVKAERYRKREDRLLSICAGLLLYKILSVTSDTKMEYNAYGKPFLKNGKFFSLSHSGNYAFLAINDDVIGIDAERIRQRKDGVGERMFTLEEQLYAKKDDFSFFSVWTRKEAVVKALGTGLHTSFQSFDVLHSQLEIQDIHLFLATCPFNSEYVISSASTQSVKIETVCINPSDIF